MYGMIHKAARSFVVERYGSERWDKIVSDADVGDEHFLSMETYDDEIMYTLIACIANDVNQSGDEVLISFGRHFILGGISSHHRSLMMSYGSTCFELLDCLNDLHEAIKSSFLNFKPPRFTVSYINDSEIDLLYESTRAGLTPFVRGLIFGLGEVYGETLAITKEEVLPVDVGGAVRFRIDRG